jgi:predicted transcriptional regulator YdeE
MTGSPRLERFGPLMLTGLMREHSRELDDYGIVQAINRQWDEYMLRRVPPPWSPDALRFGVTGRMADGDLTLTYFCGAAPSEPPETPPGFIHVVIPCLTWAVFPFYGSVTAIPVFIHQVFGRDLAAAGLTPAPDGPDVPEFIERYDWSFDPASAGGGLELMVPVAA